MRKSLFTIILVGIVAFVLMGSTNYNSLIIDGESGFYDITLPYGATIHNTNATTLTITETNIAFVGTVAFTGTQAITGSFSVDGATVTLDGSTSVRGISAGFVSFESPATRIGPTAATYMNIAVADTTGNTTITHVNGSTDLVTWTAAGGFDFVGPINLDATSISTTLGVTGTSTLAGIVTTDGVGAIVADKATAVESLAVHTSVVTFTLTGANDLDLADGDHGTGVKFYDLPEGRILVLGATINASVTVNSVFNSNPNDVFYLGVGTAVGADDNTLSGTEQDIIPVITLDTVGSTVLTLDVHGALAASAHFDGTTTPIDLYMNAAIADTSNTDASTYAITGTLTITWINLGDY